MRLVILVLILSLFARVVVIGKTNQLLVIDQPPKLHPYPVARQNFKYPPAISARSAIVADLQTGLTLFEKAPDALHLPASTTKLMTALVALERCSPDEIGEVSAVNREGTQMGLAQGDKVTVRTLLWGMLVASGNDAAYALADFCSQSLTAFVVSMNQKAKELGMRRTHYQNPAGFDSRDQYTTARDLTVLAKAAVANPLLSKIVATKNVTLADVSGVKVYYLENINELLGEVEGIEGVKTGQTEGALENLITKTTRGGHTIIGVVLGSSDRFGESKTLIEWAFKNYQWVVP